MTYAEETLQLTTYHIPEDFLAKINPILGSHESANNLILGLAYQLVDRPEIYKQAPYLATIEKEGSLVLAALMTPPHHLLLWSETIQPGGVFPLLKRSLETAHWQISGVNGHSEISSAFAMEWAHDHELTYNLLMSLRVHELQKVVYFPPVNGKLRLPAHKDLDLMTRWLYAFELEALEGEGNHNIDAAQQTIISKVNNQEVYIWDDGHPVSMAFKTRALRKSICISGVYTPPELRRRGYASACVAHLSRLLLDSGYQYCCLFTDLSNPTSNSIYQRIGYVPVCDYSDYQFD
jgi:uncharacterized protein